jgi:hypothetical protein
MLRYLAIGFAPYCFVIEALLRLREGKAISRYPMDRLTGAYVLDRNTADLVSAKGVSYLGSLSDNLKNLHNAVKTLRMLILTIASLTVASLATGASCWVSCGLLYTLLPMILYYCKLLSVKEKLLEARQSDRIEKLSWTENLIRRISGTLTRSQS